MEYTKKEILVNILNKLDACVYITDLETDEILFINDKMAHEFGGARDFLGQKCWETLQTGLTERCSFCPKPELLKSPDSSHVWEEHNTVTGKYYKNTDCIIEWTDGRTVHMQHSVDISEIKLATFSLQHQLERQELMGEIAQSFTGVGEIEDLVETALEKIGNFIGANIMYIAQDLPEEQKFLYVMQWSRDEAQSVRGAESSYAGREAGYRKIRDSEMTIADRLSSMMDDEFVGLRLFSYMGRITVPIIIKNHFWGYLGILLSNHERGFDESDFQMARFMGSILSTTLEHREAELKLFRTEQQLRAVMDNISLAICWKDKDRKYVGFNKEFTKMVGANPEAVVGKTDSDFWGAELAARNAEEDRSVWETGEIATGEIPVVFPGRGEGWMRAVKSLMRDKTGEPTGIVSILEDITTQKHAELELQRMSSIVENSPQYITYINREGKYRYVNRAAYDVTGYTTEELMEGGLELVHDAETVKRIREEILPEIYARKEYSFELPLIRKDGTMRVMLFSSFIIGDDEYNCATIAADITDRRRLENELMVEKETAERANSAKTEFLSRMSHEIRTPMNAIIGMARIANKADDIVKKQYCLDKIDVASRHLLGLINDILDMSRIETEKFELSSEELHFENMIMEAVNVITFLSDEKEQTLIVRIDDTLPPYVMSDELRMKQVITNLLSNAIKFTDKGGTIWLNVKRTGQTDSTVKVTIEVEDTGIGIGPEQIKKLFTAFEQADGSITRKYGGSGLGLAICKKIVTLMGGDIWVESEPGAGAKFIFTVELKLGKSAGETAQPLHGQEGVRILVVDDAEEIRQYCKRIMESFGVSCDVAADGYAALERVNLAQASGGYDIIFVDWRMPGMDGIELTRKIKQVMGENTVVIMISMMEWDKVEKQARAAGIQKFLPKPLFPAMLRDTITEIINRKAIGGMPPAAGPEYNFRGYRILLAEDVEVNREIIFATMEPTGLTMDFAANGMDAVRLMQQNPDRYDLILMDIHMPEMGGYEATERIRKLEFATAKTIPIIAMTADVFKEDIEKCRKAGMNSHIPKPVDPEELMKTLSKFLSGRPQKTQAQKGEDNMSEAFDVASVINVKEGLDRVLGSKKLYYKLLGDCKLNEHSRDLAAAISGGDRTRAMEIAHMLKGITANLSLTAVHKTVVELEAALKAGVEAGELMERLRGTAEETTRAITYLLEQG